MRLDPTKTHNEAGWNLSGRNTKAFRYGDCNLDEHIFEMDTG